MYENEIDNYKSEIIKQQGNQIEKVVIDVRGNKGGSDIVWQEIISMIINKPIHYQQHLAFRDNELVKKKLTQSGIKYTKDDMDDNPLYIGNNIFFCLHGEQIIKPSENSLLYDGNIYVIVDDKCFSSTLAFSAVCQNVEQLITVGMPSGYFGGQGVTPLYFMLPNSKLVFRVECSLDINQVNLNNPEDFYHANVEIPVHMTIDEKIQVYYYDGEFYKEDFLYNIDPIFKEVLKLP
jgi:C-terminal processing protease CtpA/Prc